MSTDSLATSSKKYSGEKGNFKVDIELLEQASEPVMFLAILNNLSKDFYALRLDNYDIEREKQLNRIFHTVAEIYQEITRSFDQVEISDRSDCAILIFEVAMGSFRKEKIELIAKKREGQESNLLMSEHSPLMLMEKVPVDKVYYKDFNIFKEEMISICDRISKSELAKKIAHSEKWDKSRLKNMFITFSNVILKQYRKNTCFHDPKVQAKYIKYRQENNFLIQKNQLLHNIYKKAIENTKDLPIPELKLDFDLPFPRNLTVLMQNQIQVPLQQYLPSFDEEGMKKKIDFYDQRRQQIIKSEKQINLLREKRLEDIDSWFFDLKRKQKRLQIKGRKSDFGEASPHFRQF